ncbi:MAG TPA: hypothetical protein VD713_01985, partial [Sphingomonadales bacterium]|nr:hypothetical protein [Sphingomonadales bacterium]
RLVAGAARGRGFLEPMEVKGTLHRGSTGVDEWAAATLKFPGNLLAQVTCGTRTEGETVARVFGSKGSLHVPSPWFGCWGPGSSKLYFQKSWRHKPRRIEVKADRMLYALEADEVGECLKRGRKESLLMPWRDSLGNAAALDRWLKQD